ncbi:MAG: chitobiase/beta-hexosaminidase C-terminal domain-containing protein [Candidatus Melainabacteria bacterium]|nr:chitobiase/beta-hexosaminidase C-terminal domain-containing protein [Candidatus Melainabacteria bacterium]
MKLLDQIKLLQRRTPAYFAVSVFLQIAATAAALATTAPTITPGTGVYSKVESSVTISGDPGDSLYFTTDGSNPTSSSTPYTTPISIGSSATIKAIAYASGVPSSVTTAYIDNEVNTLPVPRSGLKLWLKGDFGVTSSVTLPCLNRITLRSCVWQV